MAARKIKLKKRTHGKSAALWGELPLAEKLAEHVAWWHGFFPAIPIFLLSLILILNFFLTVLLLWLPVPASFHFCFYFFPLILYYQVWFLKLA